MKTSVKETERNRAKRIRDHSYCVDQKHMKPIDPHTELSLSQKNNVPFVQIVMAAVECVCVYIASISNFIFFLLLSLVTSAVMCLRRYLHLTCSQGVDTD